MDHNYRTEFPDGVTVPDFLLRAPWEDRSWHNDACPSFYSAPHGLLVWVEYDDPAARETEGPKYLVCEDDDNGRSHAIYCCEDVSMLQVILARYAPPQQAIPATS